jgi:hypothetical protein
MNELLFATSIITTILWSAGYFAFKAGVGIHIFLGIAVLAIFVQLIRRKRSMPYPKKIIKS